MTWKKISSKTVFKSKWMTVTDDKVETETGHTIDSYGVVHKKPFSIAIPWDGKETVLVGQYRYTVDKFSWEFPMGHFEGDSVEDTAIIELEEETGLKAEKMEKIGSFYPANGFLNQEAFVFVATGLTETKPNREGGEEGMVEKKVTPKELNEMIVKGEIKDGPTIVAFKMFEEYLDK